MAKDALGQELEVGFMVLYATSMSSPLYRDKVKKICDKMVILNNNQRKFHESVVIIPSGVVDSEYIEDLEKTSRHMGILEALGVDNWAGYGMVGDDHCTECMYSYDDCECE